MPDTSEIQFEEQTPSAAPEVEAKPEAPAAQVEQPAESAEQSEQEDESEEGQQPPEEKKEKAWKPKGPPESVPYAEFSKSRAEIRQLREQLEALQAGRMAPAEQQARQVPAAADGMPPEPKAEDFDTFEAFQKAERDWIIDVAEARAVKRLQEQSSAQHEATQTKAVVDSFEARMQTARAADPEVAEIEDYLLPAAPHLHPMVRQALLSSDNPAPLLRHLAESGQSLEEIVRKTHSNPVAMVMEFGRYIEKTASRQPAAQLPIIPPTKTVGSGRGFKNETPIDRIARESGYPGGFE